MRNGWLWLDDTSAENRRVDGRMNGQGVLRCVGAGMDRRWLLHDLLSADEQMDGLLDG